MGAQQRHLAEQVLDTCDDWLPEAPEEAVARRIGEVDGAVAYVRVAVPALRRERALRRRIRYPEPREQRVIYAPVHVHETDGVELLVAGEAAVGLAGDGPGGVVRAGGVSTLAPGIERESLEHRAALVGDDGDRAQMVLVEVARERRAAHVLYVHADEPAGCNEIV